MQLHVDAIRDSGRIEGKTISTLIFVILNMRASHREEPRAYRPRAPVASTSARPFCAIHQMHGHATKECSKLDEMRKGVKSRLPPATSSRVPMLKSRPCLCDW